jgi:hypothetical protein
MKEQKNATEYAKGEGGKGDRNWIDAAEVKELPNQTLKRYHAAATPTLNLFDFQLDLKFTLSRQHFSCGENTVLNFKVAAIV